MNPLAIEAVGLMAPGLAGWPASQAVLAGQRPYAAEPMPAAMATLLPANERRRVTATIKLALQVAQEAMAQVALPPDPSPSNGRGELSVRTVFASSGGDSEILDKICVALTQPDRPVSPTHFHQSVHNTPAGYWSIATGCMQPSLSLAAYDGSFAAGLREAAALAWADQARVLLVVYDLPMPFPLAERRQIVAPFAAALLLNPVATVDRLALLRLASDASGQPADRLDDAGLERLRAGNPAARGLPLLCAMAQGVARRVILSASARETLRVEVEP
ncbi:MAG: beta-ketoacyl synthase chain length factor [Candidatus Contendobacter sp.]|nr:beta-ketoacyl synthase chain length factor [Candidatus Contendobacter sp.]MDS4059977.1 beta-ketoacyl synthase chain length factor [Candidatus Contendobacter sp.]